MSTQCHHFETNTHYGGLILTDTRKIPTFPKNRPFNIIVAGVGGQGILLAARLIAQAATLEGFSVSVGETFGASRRGGTVLSHIRLTNPQTKFASTQRIALTGALVPKHMLDVLIGLEPLETLRAALYLNTNTNILLNENLQPPVEVIANRATAPTFSEIKKRLSKLVSHLWTVNALKLASDAGELRTTNTVMIGALAGLKITPISLKAFETTLQSQFQNEKIQQMNNRAFQLGLKAVS